MLDAPDGAQIACRHRPGSSPGVMFCGGFRSDMSGVKAVALDRWADRTGRGFARFDYRGHGKSSGAFTDGAVGLWRDDTLLVLDRMSEGPVVLVGSSMGAWIALLVALARPERVRGLVLIAAAVDFTEELVWQRMPDPVRAVLQRDGVWSRASDYSDQPDEITMRLIEEGRNHLLFGGPIRFDGPVRLLHGTADETVPWDFATRTADALTSNDVEITLVKGGDHRLSGAADLRRLCAAVEDVANRLG